MPSRPLIAAIGCGGTISSLGRDSTDVLDYPDFGTKLPIDQVLARYPEIATVADVMPVPFRSVGSTAIGAPIIGYASQLTDPRCGVALGALACLAAAVIGFWPSRARAGRGMPYRAIPQINRLG